MFETLTLIQTGKIKNFPVVLIGKDYWQKMTELLDVMIQVGTIHREDLDLFLFTDSLEEAIQFIQEKTITTFGFERKQKVTKPSWWLGEN
jgi:hypothetical protein